MPDLLADIKNGIMKCMRSVTNVSKRKKPFFGAGTSKAGSGAI